MSDIDWRRILAELMGEERLLGHDGAGRFRELENRMRLADALSGMGVEPSRSDRRNVRLYKAALMKSYGVRKWRDAIDAYKAPRPGDAEWSGPAREAKLLLLTERLSDRPSWSRENANPAFDRLQAVREQPRHAEAAPPSAPEQVPITAANAVPDENGMFPPLPLSEIAKLLDAGRLPRNGRSPNDRPEW